MKTTQWDRIVTSAPLNTTAAVVRDGQGEAGAVLQRFSEPRWVAPPTTIAPPHPTANLTGQIFGRFRVVGYLGKGSGTGADRHRWVVRCSCGIYTSRRTPALRSTWESPDHEPMCEACGYAEHMKVVLEAAKRGRWPDGKPCNRGGLNTASGSILLKDSTHPSKTKDAA